MPCVLQGRLLRSFILLFAVMLSVGGLVACDGGAEDPEPTDVPEGLSVEDLPPEFAKLAEV